MDLILFYFWVQWEGEHFLRRLLRLGEGMPRISKIRVRGLQMSRNRVVNAGLNAFLLQGFLQVVAMIRSQCVEVIDVPGPRHFRRPFDAGACQKLVVLGDDGAPSLGPALDMA